jgi:hypothetical protein
MNTLQKITGIILSLSFPTERKLSWIETLVAVSDNEKLLVHNINLILDEIDKELSAVEKKDSYIDEDKKKMELIRTKLSSLIS